MKSVNKYKKYIDNSGWLLAERVIGILLSFTIGILTVRYLGPERLGVLSYSIAIVSFAAPFANLGLNAIIQREFLNKPEDQGKILITVLCMKTLAGSVAFIIITLFALLFNFHDERVKYILPILASTLILTGFTTVFGSWFHSQLKAKFSAISKQAGTLTDALLRLVSILNSLSLVFFVLTKIVSKIVSAVVFYSLFKKIAKISFALKNYDKKLAKSLLAESLWLMTAAFSAIIYFKIDQVMLGHLMGMNELGIYSAAVRLSEGFYFIPGIIMASYYPVMINARKLSDKLYQNHLQNAYNIMFAISLPCAVLIFFASNYIINILYGETFSGAGIILSIHVWACIFVFWGSVLNKWFIVEGFAKFGLYRSLLGATVNIILNSFLIPYFGGVGAAVATFLSYGMANLLICFLFKKSRYCGWQMLNSILLFPKVYVKILSFLYEHLKPVKT